MSDRLHFTTRKTLCPCGHGKDFTPLVGHTSGGKCWANHCGQKFFPPTDASPAPRKYIAPVAITATAPEETYTFDREHIYWTADGTNYLFRVVIHKAPSGRKKVWQERWDGTVHYTQSGMEANGVWRRGLDGVALTLYNAPLLPEWKYYYDTHPDESRLLYIVEGEKDAESLWARGLAATCNPMGAGKWKPEYSPLVAGFDVVVLPDYDDAGERHAADVIEHITAYARSVRIVRLWELMPDLPHKGDVTDYFERGGII